MDVDNHLLLLATAPVPVELEHLDGAALAGQARRERREAQALTSLAAVAALGVGIVSGLAPTDGANGAAMPFGPPVALTPLLALGRG